MNGTDALLGVVEGGLFKRLSPSGDVGARLTRIAPQTSVPPESEEIDLADCEGAAIMVTGLDQGGWIYSADVVDRAGPILTAVVRQAFTAGDESAD